jgi:hypothetical protein
LRGHRWGLIVLLHQGQRVASRSPEGLTGEGGQQPIKRIAVGLAVGAGPQTMGRRDRQRAETIRLQQLLKIADGARQLGHAAALT